LQAELAGVFAREDALRKAHRLRRRWRRSRRTAGASHPRPVQRPADSPQNAATAGTLAQASGISNGSGGSGLIQAQLRAPGCGPRRKAITVLKAFLDEHGYLKRRCCSPTAESADR
jgi:hypothetical protein